MKMPSIITATCGSVICRLPRHGRTRLEVRNVGAPRGRGSRMSRSRSCISLLLGLLDVVLRLDPFAGAHAVDAAEDLRDALDEEQDAGGDDDRLELEDGNAGGAITLTS